MIDRVEKEIIEGKKKEKEDKVVKNKR